MHLPIIKFCKTLEEIAGGDKFVLLGVTNVFEYINGQKTDKVISIKYKVVNPDSFENFEIKVNSNVPIVTQEQIDSAEVRFWVSFENAVVKPFKVEYGKVQCSVTAELVKLVKG